jgi:hypothetical protein
MTNQRAGRARRGKALTRWCVFNRTGHALTYTLDCTRKRAIANLYGDWMAMSEDEIKKDFANSMRLGMRVRRVRVRIEEIR